jgi:hypothetical protein
LINRVQQSHEFGPVLSSRARHEQAPGDGRASDVATVAPPFQDIAGLAGRRELDAIRRARLFLASPYQESAASSTRQQLMRMGRSF